MNRMAAVCLCLGLCLVVVTSAAVASGVTKEVLPNGMRVLLLPSRNAPIVGSVVVVEAGSVYETAATSGSSHFLEHLLFNGTETMSQEELYEATDLIGAYSNATTGRLQTTFMMVVPSANLRGALEIQRDMLFRSVLPEEKLEKERGIILEELGKDRTSETYDIDRLEREMLYPNSPYGLPVLGTTLTIETISRDRILGYYWSRYVPQAMTVFLVGDFEPSEALGLLAETLGAEPPSPTTPPPPPLPPDLATTDVQHFVRPLSRGHLTVLLPAPPIGGAMRLPMEALVEYLGGGSASLLGTLVQERVPGAVLSFQAGLVQEPGPGRMRITVEYDPSFQGRDLLQALLEATASFRAMGPEGLREDWLEEWKTSERTAEYFDRERPHYYGMLRATTCALEGPWAVASRPERVAALSWSDVTDAADLVRSEPYRAVIFDAGGGSGSGDGETPVSEARLVGLDNGATVAVLRSDESPVLALHHLTVGRASLEPPHADGLTELVHKMIPEGVAGGDAADLESRLRGIGAELKTADLDWIPYDDYDTRPDYAFLRLQTLDEYGHEAFRILDDILHAPTLSADAFEKSRAALLARSRKDAKNPREQAQSLLRQMIYGDFPAARNPYGTPSSLENVTLDDARAYWETLSDPGKTFLAIGTGLPVEQVLEWITTELYPGTRYEPMEPGASPLEDFWEKAGRTAETRFSDDAVAPAAGRVVTPGALAQEVPGDWSALDALVSARTRLVVDSLGAGRGHVLVACLLTDLDPGRRSAWTAWNAWVSDRLAFRLREEMGMAYSIGSSLTWLGPTRALWVASAGTRTENLAPMTAGLLEGPKLAQLRPASPREIQKAVSGTLGRQLMRRSTRMKKCLYAAVSVLHGRAMTWDEEQMEDLASVRPEDVIELAQDLAARDLPTLAIVIH